MLNIPLPTIIFLLLNLYIFCYLFYRLEKIARLRFLIKDAINKVRCNLGLKTSKERFVDWKKNKKKKEALRSLEKPLNIDIKIIPEMYKKNRTLFLKEFYFNDLPKEVFCLDDARSVFINKHDKNSLYKYREAFPRARIVISHV